MECLCERRTVGNRKKDHCRSSERDSYVRRRQRSNGERSASFLLLLNFEFGGASSFSKEGADNDGRVSFAREIRLLGEWALFRD